VTSEYARTIEDARAAEREWLRGPESVLAAVARHELPVGSTLRFGPAPGADVTLPGMAREVTVAATADAFVVDGAPSGSRTVDVGRYRLRLSHQNFPAVVVLDAESPRRRDPVELRWFPVDQRLCLRARLVEDRAAQLLGATASADRAAERVGWVDLVVDGERVRFSVARLLEPGVPSDHLEIYFRDATTGRESYEVGRYVAVEREADALVVDFNKCYNPACSISPFYNCLIPPRENHVSVPIRAGEMTPLVRSSAPHG
jgi:uncharacterized protein (DUF1684 family)